MEILDALRGALKYLRRERSDETWALDEESFEAHFGESYLTFCDLLGNLDQAHGALYEKTKEINPEAAVVWVFFLSTSE